jgi:hypothetical protein
MRRFVVNATSAKKNHSSETLCGILNFLNQNIIPIHVFLLNHNILVYIQCTKSDDHIFLLFSSLVCVDWLRPKL